MATESVESDRDHVLNRAKKIINGDRAKDYGDAWESFDRIARLWSPLLGVTVTAADVAKCLIALKLSRLSESPDHEDSWVDIAGYAALGYEVAGGR